MEIPQTPKTRLYNMAVKHLQANGGVMTKATAPFIDEVKREYALIEELFTASEIGIACARYLKARSQEMSGGQPGDENHHLTAAAGAGQMADENQNRSARPKKQDSSGQRLSENQPDDAAAAQAGNGKGQSPPESQNVRAQPVSASARDPKKSRAAEKKIQKLGIMDKIKITQRNGEVLVIGDVPMWQLEDKSLNLLIRDHFKRGIGYEVLSLLSKNRPPSYPQDAKIRDIFSVQQVEEALSGARHYPTELQLRLSKDYLEVAQNYPEVTHAT